jgi:hypothetical protein
MPLREWLRLFRDHHVLAKRGALTGAALSEYHDARDELARALLAAQRVALTPGQAPRRSLRAARALQADLEFFDGTLRVTTQSISSGGFAALVARAPKVEERIKVTLRIPGGESLAASAEVVEVTPQPGRVQASFRWLGLEPNDVERLEMLVFDAVLEQLTV